MEREGGILVLSDIVWIEGVNGASLFHLHGAEDVRVKEPVASLEARLDPPVYAPISASALVCISHLKGLRASKEGKRTIVLLDGTTLQVTRGIRSWIAPFLPVCP